MRRAGVASFWPRDTGAACSGAGEALQCVAAGCWTQQGARAVKEHRPNQGTAQWAEQRAEQRTQQWEEQGAEQQADQCVQAGAKQQAQPEAHSSLPCCC
mmetsp:Transcript_62235/g.200646  ORF Transcript_62235/g.200646 Transcript_62235/m.200646 type:complete len:99 (+) Transcript_62235:101-397(+)